MRSAPPAQDWNYVFAVLLAEPFRLTFAEIAALTDRQIFGLLFWPRDDDGRLRQPGTTYASEEGEGPLSREEQRARLFEAGRAFGMTDAELENVWRTKYGPGA